MHVDHPARMQWWAKCETLRASTVRPAPATNLFRADREDYATQARLIADQGTLPFDPDEAVIPCDQAGCGV